jgi:hypothetical protein
MLKLCIYKKNILSFKNYFNIFNTFLKEFHILTQMLLLTYCITIYYLLIIFLIFLFAHCFDSKINFFSYKINNFKIIVFTF